MILLLIKITINMFTQKSMHADSMIGQVVLKKYTLLKKLGEGSFGMLYKASSPEGDFALKFEKRTKSNLLLETEGYIMNYLKGPGVPQFKTYSSTNDYNILVMQLLGKSLEGLLSSSKSKTFTIRTVCNVAIQMLKIIQRVHDKHIIHRDIKPDNFAIGLNEESTKIYLIDFGLAKKYRSSRTLEQYPLKSGKKLTGTARYASINALSGLEQSRRDDLESIGYVLVYFLKGSLPWQGLLIKKKEDRYKKILEKKRDTSASDLCSGFPKEFEEFINITRNLGYTEEPQYDYLIWLMKNVLERENFIFDYYVDWVTEEESKKNEDDSINNENGNQRITVVNKYYHQVNNIVINNAKEDNNSNNVHHNHHMQYTKTDEAQYNENSRERVNSLSPIKTMGKKISKNNLKMQSSTKAQCSLTHHVPQEVPLYHKISSVGNNRSKCCIM